MNGIIEGQVSDIMECNKSMVQIAAVAGMTVLGSVALFVNNSIGMTIAVAVAGAVGAVVGWLFPSPLGSNDD